MKTLTLALVLAPLSALADTDVRCQSGGVYYNLIGSNGGITQASATLTIVANGILHTVIDTRIDSVDVSQNDKVIANVTTLNQDGEEDADSGKAVIELAVNARHDDQPGQFAHGEGHIHLSKYPPPHPANIRFRPDYDLTGCVGTV